MRKCAESLQTMQMCLKSWEFMPKLKKMCLLLSLQCNTTSRSEQWQAYSFSSLFMSDVATKSQKDHKLFSATYNLCSKRTDNKKI